MLWDRQLAGRQQITLRMDDICTGAAIDLDPWQRMANGILEAESSSPWGTPRDQSIRCDRQKGLPPPESSADRAPETARRVRFRVRSPPPPIRR